MQLKAHGVELTASPAYATVNLANLTDVYLQASVTVPSATLTSIQSQTDGDGLEVMFVDLANSGRNGVEIVAAAGAAKIQSFYGTPVSTTVTADTPTLIDVRMQAGSPPTITIKVNGSVVYGPTAEGNNNASFQTADFGICDLFTFAGSADWTIYLDNIKVGTTGYGTTDIFSEDFEGAAPLANFNATAGDVSVASDPATGAAAVGGICVAFDDAAFTANPAWTRIDDVTGLQVQSWSIRRGRATERDKTGVGTATITGIDTAGILDPTNSGSAYAGNLDPTKQVAINLYDPVAAAWSTIFRGFVADWNYELDVSEGHIRFEIECVDALDLFADAEVIPDVAGNTVPGESTGDVAYDEAAVRDRFLAVLADAALSAGVTEWPSGLIEAFTGNVRVYQTIYSNGTPLLQLLDDTADAEFPGVANRYVSKTGVVTFHGRLARFDPTNPDYNIQTWKVGDLAAFTGDSDTAVISALSFTRGKTNLINSAIAYPKGIAQADIAGQYVADATSVSTYGARSVSFPDLITEQGHDAFNVYNVTANDETKKYATYFVDNYKDPRTRIASVSFTSQMGTGARAANVWALLCGVELNDIFAVTTTHPGGGGFASEDSFVEGVTYEADNRGGSVFTNVTLTVDVSPKAYYTTNPFS